MPARKPAATAPTPRPSGFSWATPGGSLRALLDLARVGVARDTFERRVVDLVGDVLLGAPLTSVLWPSASTVSPISLAGLLYVLPDLAWVFAHCTSSFVLSIACSGTGGTACSTFCLPVTASTPATAA